MSKTKTTTGASAAVKPTAAALAMQEKKAKAREEQIKKARRKAAAEKAAETRRRNAEAKRKAAEAVWPIAEAKVRVPENWVKKVLKAKQVHALTVTSANRPVSELASPGANGVRHHLPLTACGLVWVLFEFAARELEAPAPTNVVAALATPYGLNANNVATELTAYKGHYGIFGRIPAHPTPSLIAEVVRKQLPANVVEALKAEGKKAQAKIRK